MRLRVSSLLFESGTLIFRVAAETKSKCLSSRGARSLILDLYLEITAAIHTNPTLSLCLWNCKIKPLDIHP